MEAINKDWSQIKLRINIKTSIEKAYSSWATQQGLESWFLKKAPATDAQGKSRKTNELLSKADTYKWTWHGYHDDMRHEGAVLEANGKDKFAFSFSANCPVTVSIYKELEEVIVELVEDNIPVAEGSIFKHYTSNTMGWTFYLTNLKSVLEGGLDLRNFNPSLKNVITA
jgi:hypothetical protein